MNCKSIQRLWPAWSAGDLSQRKLEIFEAHLETCADCRQLADQLTRASQVTRESLGSEAGLDRREWERLLAGAAQRQARGFRWAPWTAVTAAAAAAVLALVLWWPGSGGPARQLDGGLMNGPDAGSYEPDAPAPRQVALVDAADKADRYELRMATSDPKVKIVWVFDRNLDI